MDDRIIFIVAGIVGAIFGGVQVYRTRGEDFAGWGTVVIGVGLAIIGLN